MRNTDKRLVGKGGREGRGETRIWDREREGKEKAEQANRLTA